MVAPATNAPIDAQLGAVVEPVDRQLHEAVELKVVGEGVDEAGAQENGLRSAQVRLRRLRPSPFP